MTIAAGETIYYEFTTHALADQSLVNADSLPTGTLVKNGVDTAVAVTITNKATGIYKAQFTIPATYAAGDEVGLRIAATIGGVATGAVVWQESLSSGATTPAALTGDYRTDLIALRAQSMALLKEVRAEQKPSYNVNGQQVDWKAYAEMLKEEIRDWTEEIGDGGAEPWEEEMQLFL
jgi:hypothetical protein